MRKKFKDGLNPVEERRKAKAHAKLKAAKAKTFQECAKAWIEAKDAGLVATHVVKINHSLARHVYPVIGGYVGMKWTSTHKPENSVFTLGNSQMLVERHL